MSFSFTLYLFVSYPPTRCPHPHTTPACMCECALALTDKFDGERDALLREALHHILRQLHGRQYWVKAREGRR